MKHFDKQEWLVFREGKAGTEEVSIMEDHLTICEDCRQIFLSSIDADEISRAEAFIPPDFTARTLNLLQAPVNKPGASPYQQKAGVKRRLLSFYVAAAAVTLMLMSGGVFQSAARQVTNIPVNYSPQAPARQYFTLPNWPGQLREKTAGWMDAIEWKKHKEVK